MRVKEARGLIGECDVSEHPEATLYLLGAAAMLSQSDLILHGVGDEWKTRRALDLLRRLKCTIGHSGDAIKTSHSHGSKSRGLNCGARAWRVSKPSYLFVKCLFSL